MRFAQVHEPCTKDAKQSNGNRDEHTRKRNFMCLMFEHYLMLHEWCCVGCAMCFRRMSWFGMCSFTMATVMMLKMRSGIFRNNLCRCYCPALHEPSVGRVNRVCAVPYPY